MEQMKGKDVSKSMSGKAKCSEWLTSRIHKAKGQWQKMWQSLIRGHECAVLRSLGILWGGGWGEGHVSCVSEKHPDKSGWEAMGHEVKEHETPETR